MKRPSGRAPDALRDVILETDVSKYAEGSCLAKFGETHVLCTASIEDRVPPFLRNSGRGWVTAEYGMLPRSTETRIDRRRAAESGRTQEIQRLIGRSLRAVTKLDGFGERQIRVDCDEDTLVIKAEALGPGVCHNGFRTCFYRRFEDGEWKQCAERAYDPGTVYK